MADKLKLARMYPAVSAVLMATILTLYLAPTKFFAADILAGIFLGVALGVLGLRGSGVKEAFKPLLPLLALALYVILFNLARETGRDGVLYVKDLLMGFVPLLLTYIIYRNLPLSQVQVLVLATFLVPGLVHMTFMYLDIYVAAWHGNLTFVSSSKHGLLESIKDVPRLGRRYLSIALLHLLCGGLWMAWLFRRAPLKYWAWGLSSLCVLSLALLDARAAYVSLIIGMLLLLMAVGPAQAWPVVKTFLVVGQGKRLLLTSLLIIAVGIGYSAGKSRWVAMGDSFAAAVHDVFDSDLALAQRPFVNERYWSAPIEDINACYLEGHFRCRIDQSAYLRMAWLLTGIKSLVEHPWGIGYTDDNLAHLWGVAGEKGKFQRSDSFLVNEMVSFGIPAILLYSLLVWGLLSSLRRAVQSRNASALLVMVCGILLVCVGRGMVDVISDGLWRYMMALTGMYYGILHSRGWETRN